jgi:hypothetical protein
LANNTFQLRRTTVAGRQPNTTSSSNSQYINAGELALNLTDRLAFTSDGTNLIYIGANQVNMAISGVLTANGSNGSGQALLSNSTGGVYWGAISATPAGSNTMVQFNDSGALGANSNFIFDKATNILSVTGTVNATAHSSGGGYNTAANGFFANSTIRFIGNTTQSISMAPNLISVLTVGSVSNSNYFIIGNTTVFTQITSNTTTISSSLGTLTVGNSTVNTVLSTNGITFNDSSRGNGIITTTWDETAPGVITALARGWAMP